MENTKKCPFCAEEIKVEAIKCKHCGSSLNKAEIWKITKNDLKYKNKNLTWVLALFLWWFWVHKFYLEEYIYWIVYLFFCWTFIPAIISFIEAIYFWNMKKEEFDSKYNKN